MQDFSPEQLQLLVTDPVVITNITNIANWTGSIYTWDMAWLYENNIYQDWSYLYFYDWSRLIKTKIYDWTTSWWTTTESVTSMLNVWSITSWEVVPLWSTITDFVKQLLLTTFYPTITAPTFSLTSNQANWQEIWSLVNLVLTHNFNRWAITWKLVLGVRQPATFQDFRAWAATNYNINGTNTLLVNTLTIPNYALLSTQTLSWTVSHAIWPQPTDSSGANYLTPLAWSTSTNTTTITALYPYFRWKSAAVPVPWQALINSGTKVVASSTGTITISFASTATDYLRFAIPQTSTSKTKWYINALNNWNIWWPANLFWSEVIQAIDSPTVLWNGVNYKIYVSNYQSAVSLPMELRNS